MLYARRKLVAFLTVAFVLGVVPALASQHASSSVSVERLSNQRFLR
jgi:hypothetical protein